VTCRHVGLDFFIRLNTVSGGAELAVAEGANWQYHADESVDIAATSIMLNAARFDHLTLPLSQTTRREDLGCGQQIHIVGLFRLHFGAQRNIPIVHTGHIAALPDARERVLVTNPSSGKPILAESYLVEAQTLEGLSGSPVFVQEYVAWKGTGISDSGDSAA